MRLTAALTFFVLPLAIAPTLSFYYDVVPKAVILFVAVAVALIAALWTWHARSELLTRGSRRLYVALLCASIVVALTSAAASTNSNLAWHGSNWRRFGAITQTAVLCLSLLLTGYAARAPERSVTFLRAATLAGIVAGMYGVMQYFGWDPFLNIEGYHAGEGPYRIVRPPGPLGHSDYYSAWLLWPIFWGVALTQADRSQAWRAVAAGGVATAALAVLLSGSRGSLIGLAVGLCVMAVIRRPKLRVSAAAAGSVIAAAALFYISPAGAQLRARAHWVADEPVGGARILLWADSLTMAKTRPVLGLGPDTFVAEFPRFQSVRLAQAYPDFYHESPHNLFLDSLTGEGLLGLLALVTIIVVGFACGFRAVTGPNARTAVPLLASLAAFVAAHQFTVLTIPSAVCLYTVVGMLVVLGDSRLPQFRRPRPRTVIGFSYAAAAFAFIGYGACLASADHQFALAKRALDSGNLQAANDAYSESLRQWRVGLSADLYLSRRSAAAAAEATDTIIKLRYADFANTTGHFATQSAEQRANAWYNMAALAATRNDVRMTERNLRTAIHAAPNWFKPHWTLARLLEVTGRRQDAAREVRNAEVLDGSKHSQVASSVAEILRSTSMRK